jgi:type II secretory pathway pseudopilin PulG
MTSFHQDYPVKIAVSMHRGNASFSLVEVVLALAIFSFVLVTMMALLSVALRTNKESSDQIQAANIASLLVSTRRAAPTNSGANFTNFALPQLNQSYVTNTTPLGLDGTTSPGTGTAYNLYYQVGTNAGTGPNLANVYILIWWPLGARMPTNNPSAYYELSTQVSLQ